MADEMPRAPVPGTSEAPLRESARRKSVKRLLILFAALSCLGIAMLAVSPVLGLVVLVVAEGFFAFAYLRFSRSRTSR